MDRLQKIDTAFILPIVIHFEVLIIIALDGKLTICTEPVFKLLFFSN